MNNTTIPNFGRTPCLILHHWLAQSALTRSTHICAVHMTGWRVM